ncbi:MAG: RNA pseudouridine synthase [Bacteroidales bacterium]|nr:RNA pseudouridine synthase [Bacteroidales bacterium]
MIKNFLTNRRGTPITPELRESLPDTFTNPFSYSPHPLCREAMMDVCSYLDSNSRISKLGLLGEGKMFGVLVAESPEGELGYLAAYSGVLDYLTVPSPLDMELGIGRVEEPFFVPPIYDLTSQESFFPEEEREITSLNDYINDLVHDSFAQGVSERMEEIREAYKAEIDSLQQKYDEGKAKRDALRVAGAEGAELEALIKESQFQKGEIRRAAKRMKEELEPYELEWNGHLQALESARKERREKSAALQKKIFDHFSFLNARGEERSLLKIFGDVVPPAGAGECAAPRLLQYAYLHGYKPIAMGEFWYGTEKLGRRNWEFYPSCKGKCGPILRHMLQGLKVDSTSFHTSYGCDPLPDKYTPEIIYEDEYLLAVNKPAGVLSVPGKDAAEKNMLQLLEASAAAGSGSGLAAVSAAGSGLAAVSASQDKEEDGGGGLTVVHRLDMHTSGILLFAKNEEVYKMLQRQFLQRKVEKCYLAVLDGEVSPLRSGSGVIWDSDAPSLSEGGNASASGTISLPLAADYENRPLQCVDYCGGKLAITKFEVVSVAGGKSFVKFYPVTGRTHQLRVHAAHADGLNTPIEGDLLYGRLSQRLMLHAHTLKFEHPVLGAMELVAPIPPNLPFPPQMHTQTRTK